MLNNFGVQFIMNKRPEIRYNDDDGLQDDIDDIDDEDPPNEVSFKDLSKLSEACLIRILRMCKSNFSYFLRITIILMINDLMKLKILFSEKE